MLTVKTSCLAVSINVCNSFLKALVSNASRSVILIPFAYSPSSFNSNLLPSTADTLATKEELGLKANKTEIPDVTNLATKTELEAKLDKTEFESEKANFATKSELGTVNGSARVSAVEGNKLELKEDGLYANGISITDLDEVDTGALKEELQNIANEVTNKMSVFNELTELDLVELKTQLKTEIKAELKEEILAELNASRGPA